VPGYGSTQHTDLALRAEAGVTAPRLQQGITKPTDAQGVVAYRVIVAAARVFVRVSSNLSVMEGKSEL
jgi:hypothetical protein